MSSPLPQPSCIDFGARRKRQIVVSDHSTDQYMQLVVLTIKRNRLIFPNEIAKHVQSCNALFTTTGGPVVTYFKTLITACENSM